MFPVTLRVQEKDQRKLKTHNKPDSLEVPRLAVLVAAAVPEAEGVCWSLALGKVLVLPCTSALCRSWLPRGREEATWISAGVG